MKTVHKSVLIWYSAEQMQRLVTDVARYPEFLPWCDHARVLEHHGDGVTAEVGIAFGGIKQAFVTRNTHCGSERVQMALVRGPFSQLQGEWLFAPVGPDDSTPQPGSAPMAARACRVDLRLTYHFDNSALSLLVGPVFDRIAASLVDAFVQRAEQVYG